MKKMFKNLSALVLSCILVICLGTAAFAESSVSYEGGAEKFVFLEGSEYSNTDMFNSFKNVMPGDEITQTITVRNSFSGSDYVDIYLRAVPHGEDNPLSQKVAEAEELVTMQDFLSKLSLTVKQGNRVLFSASPDELDGLKENLKLGTFVGKSKTELTLTLSVPIELGNEYANRVGEVDWVFTASQYDKDGSPKTGDESGIVLYSLLMLGSAVGAAVILKKRKA